MSLSYRGGVAPLVLLKERFASFSKRHAIANSEQGMASFPANDAAVIFCPSKTEGCMSWLPVKLRNSLGRKPSRFVSIPMRLPWSLPASQRGSKLFKLPLPEVSQVLLRSSTQPVGIWRQFPSPASTCFSLATWKLEVLAAPTCHRSLSQNCPEAAGSSDLL